MRFLEIKLGDLFLGEAAAEDELLHKDFESYYFDDESRFEKLTELKNFILIGEKGTGKTMLGNYYKMKISNEKRSYCQILDAGNLLADKLKEISNQNLTHEYKKSFIQWLLLMQTAKLIVDTHPIKKLIKFTNVYEINKLLHSNELKNVKLSNSKYTGGSIEDSIGIKASSVGAISAQISAGDNITVKPQEYFDKLDLFKKLIKKQCLKTGYTIIFDDLDSLSEPDKQSDFYSFIDTLLSEGKSLNQFLNNTKNNESKIASKYIFLLRRDVANMINENSHNFAKLESTNSIHLYWLRNYNGTAYEHPIIQIILKKLKASNETLNNLDNKQVYNLLFPNKIHENDFITFFTKYTRGRPRDFILFLKTVADIFPEREAFTEQIIIDAIPEYSKKFIAEVKNEMYIKSPRDKSLLNTGIKLISDMKKRRFKIAEVISFYHNNSSKYPPIESIEEMLDLLYQSCIIGNTWGPQRGKNTKPKYNFAYRDNSLTGLNLTKNIIVHHALQKTFNI